MGQDTELPPGDTAETILFMASTEALIGTLGRNRAERLLTRMADRLVAAGMSLPARRARSIFLSGLPRLIALMPKKRR